MLRGLESVNTFGTYHARVACFTESGLRNQKTRFASSCLRVRSVNEGERDIEIIWPVPM